jgi:hypothetical protein
MARESKLLSTRFFFRERNPEGFQEEDPTGSSPGNIHLPGEVGALSAQSNI